MESLPPLLVQKCLEFLPFAEVHAGVKQVSKATRKAARMALTRGRWRPFRYVSEQGLAVCAATGAGALKLDTDTFTVVCDDAASAVPAAACATFREAWTLDRSLVMRIICKDRGPGTYGEAYQACFLRIVEPSIDGLSGIIGAWENAVQGSSLYHPERLIRTWANSLPGGQASRFTLSLSGPAVGDGLKDWANLSYAVTFMSNLLDMWDWEHYQNNLNLLDATARAWSANWADRAKADRFVAEAVEHREELENEERREREMMEEDSYSSEDDFIPTNSPPRCLPSPIMYGAVRVEDTADIFSCGSCGVQMQVVGAAVTGAQFVCPQCGEKNVIN